MPVLAQYIERQFQRNVQQHIFAGELKVKVQRMRVYFSGGSLPLPSPEVIAVWNDLPNGTVDILPMSMKTGLVFLRAPPPTPTGVAFDAYDSTSDEPFPLNDGRLSVDDIDSPMPDVVAFPSLGRFATSDSDAMSRCSNPDRSLNRHEEDAFRFTDTGSPSDHESLSSSNRSSPAPVGLRDIANDWSSYYRARGMQPFIESLIAFGVGFPGTAPLACRIARAITRKVAKISYTEGKCLENTIRSTALAAFKKEWKSNDTWTEEPSARANSASPTSYGISVAGFVGSLFDAGICNAKDIHLSLSLLLEGEKRFDRLCAMHALLVQANDKLCKNCNLPALTEFKHEITSRDERTGEYLWATTPRSETIMAAILATIERWLASQALKRDRFQMSPCGRIRAVGPRLRNDGFQIPYGKY